MRHALHALIITCTLTLAGCGGSPTVRTTFLNSVDLANMTNHMATSFAQDDLISDRNQGDTPWVIAINRVTNHTNQVIPEREKWLYLARLRARLAQSHVAEARSLIWVIPPEQWSAVQEELGAPAAPPELRMSPTHQMTAEFYTLTSSSGAGRADTYHCAFSLFDLTTGAEIWRDAWEVKHWMEGRTYD